MVAYSCASRVPKICFGRCSLCKEVAEGMVSFLFLSRLSFAGKYQELRLYKATINPSRFVPYIKWWKGEAAWHDCQELLCNVRIEMGG